ncbi:MAG: tautomerase family protein [Bosea sp. (in: a-proteobacteria)]
MPLVRIALHKGKTAEYRKTIVDQVYVALRETFNVPEDDLFMLIDEYDPANMHANRIYMGFDRSKDLVMIQLTVSNTRGVDQKRALYAAIASRLQRELGLRGDDVFINLVEGYRENWSFGAGIAQYV